MTENATWTEEHILASDLWAIGKSMAPMTAEEELEAWRTTTGMLDSLCGMAASLMLEPLELALVDASARSREELRRAEDRLSRPEGAELTEREEERLRGLKRRSDALGHALSAVEDEGGVTPAVRARTLEVLRGELQEANGHFQRYRAEVGIPDPVRKNARKPA